MREINKDIDAVDHQGPSTPPEGRPLAVFFDIEQDMRLSRIDDRC